MLDLHLKKNKTINIDDFLMLLQPYIWNNSVAIPLKDLRILK